MTTSAKSHQNLMEAPSWEDIEEQKKPSLLDFIPSTKISQIHFSEILYKAHLFCCSEDSISKKEQRAIRASLESISLPIFTGLLVFKALQHKRAAEYNKKFIAKQKEPHPIITQKTVINHYTSARRILKTLSLYSPTVQSYLLEVNLHLAAETESKEFDNEAMRIFDRFKKKIFMENNNIIIALNYNSNIWEKIDAEKAVQKKLIALEIDEKKDTCNKAAILCNIGLFFLDKFNDKRSCLDYEKRGIEMFERIKNKNEKDNERFVRAMNNFAIHSNNDKIKLEYYEKTLDIRKKIYGDISHSEIADSYNNLGLFFYSVGENLKGLDYLKKALEEHDEIRIHS